MSTTAVATYDDKSITKGDTKTAVVTHIDKKTNEADTFYIGDSSRRRHRERDNMYLEGYTGYDWGDKLSFTVGITYATGTSIS